MGDPTKASTRGVLGLHQAVNRVVVRTTQSAVVLSGSFTCSFKNTGLLRSVLGWA